MRNFESFKEIDVCGSCDGRIMAASVNARKGVIVFQKENKIKKTIHCCHEDAIEDDFNFPAFSPKMNIFGQNEWRHRKGEQHKPKRDNLKTRSDRKIQRASRALLAKLKTGCVDNEYFYETLDFLNDGLLSFLFSSMEFNHEDFVMEACV